MNLKGKIKFCVGNSFLLLCLVLSSCTKKIENPKVAIKIHPDFTTNSSGLGEVFFFDDKTFWLHSIEYGDSIMNKIEHYDENFSLIESKAFRYYSPLNILIVGNWIYATTYTYNSATKKFKSIILKFDEHINLIASDSSSKMQAFADAKDIYFTNQQIVKLSNGKYVIALQANPLTNSDSAHIVLASYLDPLSVGTPLWVNKNNYYDYPNEIYSTEMLKMVADNQNNFYILENVRSNISGFATYLVLRKHAADGQLIWQKRFFKSNLGKNPELLIDDDKIIIGALFHSVFIFNANGDMQEISSPYNYFNGLYSLPDQGGYITAVDSFSSGFHSKKLLKFDHNFNLTSTATFGNQATEQAIFGQLWGNKFVLAAQIESPDIKKYNLAFYKIDGNLQLTH